MFFLNNAASIARGFSLWRRKFLMALTKAAINGRSCAADGGVHACLQTRLEGLRCPSRQRVEHWLCARFFLILRERKVRVNARPERVGFG